MKLKKIFEIFKMENNYNISWKKLKMTPKNIKFYI